MVLREGLKGKAHRAESASARGLATESLTLLGHAQISLIYVIVQKRIVRSDFRYTIFIGQCKA